MEIKIGTPNLCPQFSGSKRTMVEKFDSFQYIPLLDTLKALLSDVSIIEQVFDSWKRVRSDGIIEDFCDGYLFKSHPLFSKDPFALQLIPYYDELELCNPLGSHVKQHKLGIVFFTLGNIAPKYRSQLKIMNLAVVATVPVIEKHGLNAILKPFLNDINTLSTTGIQITTSTGTTRTFKGALAVFLADNLASNDLGGFKKSFSFAFRYCRTCLCTRESATESFVSESFQKRSDASHQSHLELLDGPAAENFSKTYGINKRSPLLGVKFYSMFNGGLPHDMMHDILEGVASYELKHLLSIYIKNKLFSLDDLNQRLLNFNYGYMECDKPVPILSRQLSSPDSHLRQSASQTLILLRILPFLIGSMIPEDEEHWTCFLLLRKILDIVLCPVGSVSLCNSLKILIRDHNSTYLRLYGLDAFFPKMHFLVHYPEQILQVGPMIRTWTIRHEAKLNFFKQASRLANFKNVSLSLASRHQRWMGYELASGKLINNQIECGPSHNSTGVTQLLDETKDVQDALIKIFPQISFEATIFRPAWIKKDGILYKNNNAYVITGFDGLDPVFSRVEEILVIGGDFITFLVTVYNTLYFDSHYHAFVIAITPRKSLIQIEHILDPGVLHAHVLSDGLSYITLKYHFSKA